jgi:hypothetical protein
MSGRRLAPLEFYGDQGLIAYLFAHIFCAHNPPYNLEWYQHIVFNVARTLLNQSLMSQ